MSKFVDKLTSALGISRAYEDDYDEYDEYDDYDTYDEPVKEEPKPRYSSRSASRSSSRFTELEEAPYEPQPSRRYSSSRYERSSASYEAPREVSRVSGSGASSISSANYSRLRNSKVVNLNANIQMEVVMVNPESLEEARDIAMQIKERKPVVINLEFAEPRVAQRITDLLCGCCYALNGNIQRVSDKIFMIAPDTVGFAGDLDIREKLQGQDGLMFPWHES